MEHKNYLLMAVGTTTGALEKVNIVSDLDTAKSVLAMMMATSSNINYGEIYEGRQTHRGDFRNKPVYSFRKE
jgi:hypothetical protein